MKRFYPFIPFIIIAIIIYWAAVKPRLDNTHEELKGKVTKIEKARAGHLIYFDQLNKTGYMYYSFIHDVVDIHVGDSIIKKKESDLLLIKSNSDSIIRPANDQHYMFGFY